MQISDALETSLVTLYGPTGNTRIRPLTASSKMLFLQNNCHCKSYAIKACEDSLFDKFGEDYCMKNITPSEVISTLESIRG